MQLSKREKRKKKKNSMLLGEKNWLWETLLFLIIMKKAVFSV